MLLAIKNDLMAKIFLSEQRIVNSVGARRYALFVINYSLFRQGKFFECRILLAQRRNS